MKKGHMPPHGQGEATHKTHSFNHVSRGHVSPLGNTSNPQQQPTNQAQVGGLPLPPGSVATPDAVAAQTMAAKGGPGGKL
jgi:hypothetical protein